MKNVVVDASIITKWLSSESEQHLDRADLLLTHATNNKLMLHAPELAKYEIGNVLLTSKHLSIPQADSALTTLYSLPITFHITNTSHTINIYSLATSNKLSYYDASYVYLASQLKATFITDDRKQAKNTSVKTILISDYH